MQKLEIDTPHGSVPAVLEGGGEVGILLATGAGTGQDSPGVAGLRSRLAAQGFKVLSFEYAYRAQGRAFPDRQPKLLDVHRAAVRRLREDVGGRLVLAGRSMGGRMSTILAAEGEPCSGVVVYGYPLHPAGKPDRLRVDHLPALRVPVLFISGDNDALARRDLVEQHLVPLPTASFEWIEGADHSFRRRSTSPEAMLDELARLTADWVASLAKRPGSRDNQTSPFPP